MTTHFLHGMAVEVSGEGEPVLCIHGLGGSSNTWTPIAAALQSFQRVAPDLPGSARSPLPEEALSIDGYVRRLVDLAGGLGLFSVHVVAHSMGTIVAQHLAVNHPTLVRSLALFGPLAAPPDAGRSGILARAEAARRGPAAMQEIADAIVSGATSRETKRQQPAVLAAVRESVMRQSPEGYARSCEALASAQPARVEAISVPVLLVTGDQDGVAPPANVEVLAGRIRGSELAVLPGCGHWTTFEQPQRCVALLDTFHSGQR